VVKLTRGKKRVRKFTKKMQIKLMALFAFVLLILVFLNIRIAYITAKSGDKYAKQVLSQQQYDSRTIPYKRGEIRDRNGNVLARSEKVYNLILDCYAVNGDEEYIDPTIKALVETIGVDETEVRERIASEETRDSQYQILKKNVTQEEKDIYDAYTDLSEDSTFSDEVRREREKITGIWFEEQYIRDYPMGTLASNVIGFSNDLSDGICGLESYYDDVLNGVNGREFGYLNEDSELQRTIVEPENGKTIISTIDVNIQQIVEKYITEFETENSGGPNESTAGQGSKNLGIIVSNPNTGEIYAMSTNHNYDLNEPYDLTNLYSEIELKAMSEEDTVEALNKMWYNYCISEAFEPGSTFKPVTVSSALECGALTGTESFICDGEEFVTDTTIKCDNIYGHGEETLSDAIKNSCNDALMQIGFKMGISNFCKYQRIFNFGSRTGIDLPNENTGILYSENAMHEVELATNSFGQTFTCTMIQELAAFNAVVNGGYYYQPHMVKQVMDAGGGVAKNLEPLLLKQPISAKSSKFVLEAMEQGVREGTGEKAQVPGYRVAGKTGTAEKIPRGEGNYLVSFIGCAPADDPVVSIYVVIDEPNVEDQSTGGYAQIISRKIMTELLPYLNIYQTEEITEEQLSNLGLTREEAEAGRIVEKETEEPETDEYGNVIETEPETDEYGNVRETETGEGAADNPNIPLPPENNSEDTESLSDNGGVTNEDLNIQ